MRARELRRPKSESIEFCWWCGFGRSFHPFLEQARGWQETSLLDAAALAGVLQLQTVGTDALGVS